MRRGRFVATVRSPFQFTQVEDWRHEHTQDWAASLAFAFCSCWYLRGREDIVLNSTRFLFFHCIYLNRALLMTNDKDLYTSKQENATSRNFYIKFSSMRCTLFIKELDHFISLPLNFAWTLYYMFFFFTIKFQSQIWCFICSLHWNTAIFSSRQAHTSHLYF